MSEFQRLHVGPRLSELSVHNGVVYLAGQVPDDVTEDIKGQTRPVSYTHLTLPTNREV